MPTYTPQYPSPIDATTVKANNYFSEDYLPHFAIDPAISLTGSTVGTAWQTALHTYRRFSVDLGAGKIIKRVYIENFHHSGGVTVRGIKNVLLYGSNVQAAFDSTDYSDLTDLTEIGSFQVDVHVSSDVSDPQYFLLDNGAEFRYYVFRIADSWDTSYMGVRHVELQTEDVEDPIGSFDIEAPVPELFSTGEVPFAAFHIESPVPEVLSTGDVSAQFHLTAPVPEVYVVGEQLAYTPKYPSPIDDTTVKATSFYSASYAPYLAADPALSLIGGASDASWFTSGAFAPTKFNIDTGAPVIARRIYIENFHASGASVDIGIKDVIVYGSNVSTAFDNTTYADLTDLTELGTLQVEAHAPSDIVDSKYYFLDNEEEFRYYILRVSTNHEHANWLGIRHIEFQTQDKWGPPLDILSFSYTAPLPGIISEGDVSIVGFGDVDPKTASISSLGINPIIGAGHFTPRAVSIKGDFGAAGRFTPALHSIEAYGMVSIIGAGDVVAKLSMVDGFGQLSLIGTFDYKQPVPEITFNGITIATGAGLLNTVLPTISSYGHQTNIVVGAFETVLPKIISKGLQPESYTVIRHIRGGQCH